MYARGVALGEILAKACLVDHSFRDNEGQRTRSQSCQFNSSSHLFSFTPTRGLHDTLSTNCNTDKEESTPRGFSPCPQHHLSGTSATRYIRYLPGLCSEFVHYTVFIRGRSREAGAFTARRNGLSWCALEASDGEQQL